MKIAICKLKSVSPYSQGRHIKEPKLPRELDDAYEERTWRLRLHCTPDQRVFIPPMAFANAIKEAAKYRAEQIPGKGKTTWTKHFEAGVMVADPLLLPIHRDEVESEWLFVPSDGQRGGSRRVWRCFPLIPEWSGEVTYYILDDIITKDVFERLLVTSGALIGIGRFRPRNWGYYGRFVVEDLKWNEEV